MEVEGEPCARGLAASRGSPFALVRSRERKRLGLGTAAPKVHSDRSRAPGARTRGVTLAWAGGRFTDIRGLAEEARADAGGLPSRKAER